MKYAYHFDNDYVITLEKDERDGLTAKKCIHQHIKNVCGPGVPIDQIKITNLGYDMFRVTFNKKTQEYATMFRMSL